MTRFGKLSVGGEVMDALRQIPIDGLGEINGLLVRRFIGDLYKIGNEPCTDFLKTTWQLLLAG